LPSYFSIYSSCVLIGTPDATLPSTTYTLVANNSVGSSVDATLTISVAARAPILSYSESSGTIGTPLTITPSQILENGSSITNCSIKAGTTPLPAYLSLNSEDCVLTGIPTSALAQTT
jgi:hypothetical protein